MHLDSSNRLHRGDDAVMECNHCRSQTHMHPTATPDFRALRQSRPERTGMVFQCGACGMPVFASYKIINFDVHRIDLEPLRSDEPRKEKSFTFTYIPDGVATFFRNALGCYENDLTQAFAVMCRMTTEAMINDRGENEKMKFMAQVDEIAELANLTDAEYRDLCTILFDTGTGSLLDSVDIDKGMAAILLETMKDMLHHAYIRRGRLAKKLQMRRFFADPRGSSAAEAIDSELDDDEKTLLSIVRPDLRKPTGTED
ncbi:MAG: hypothetical protein HKN56_11105 [Gammaproteobacteria bacterium]|nr:hypothetical protein [Gammaproteobacteria bacterium]